MQQLQRKSKRNRKLTFKKYGGLMAKIVNTCNFDSDYPNEKFLNVDNMTEEHAKVVAKALNDGFNRAGYTHPRYYKVVPNDYELQPGFEP